MKITRVLWTPKSLNTCAFYGLGNLGILACYGLAYLAMIARYGCRKSRIHCSLPVLCLFHFLWLPKVPNTHAHYGLRKLRIQSFFMVLQMLPPPPIIFLVSGVYRRRTSGVATGYDRGDSSPALCEIVQPVFLADKKKAQSSAFLGSILLQSG